MPLTIATHRKSILQELTTRKETRQNPIDAEQLLDVLEPDNTFDYHTFLRGLNALIADEHILVEAEIPLTRTAVNKLEHIEVSRVIAVPCRYFIGLKAK